MKLVLFFFNLAFSRSKRSIKKKEKIEHNRNDKKSYYDQTWITIKIHINHDGVRATAIMLRPSTNFFKYEATDGTCSSQMWCHPPQVISGFLRI